MNRHFLVDFWGFLVDFRVDFLVMNRKMGVSGGFSGGFSRHFRSFQQENMGMLMVVDGCWWALIIQQGWENSRKIDPTENSTWLAGKICRTTIVRWMCLEWNPKIIEANRRFSKVMFDYRMVINSKYHVNWGFTSCKWDLTWFIVANQKKCRIVPGL